VQYTECMQHKYNKSVMHTAQYTHITYHNRHQSDQMPS